VAAVGRAAPSLLGDAGTVAIAAERLFGVTNATRGDSSSTVAAVLGQGVGSDDLAASLELQLVLTPLRHVGFVVSPTLDVGVAASMAIRTSRRSVLSWARSPGSDRRRYGAGT
jgi:hypothetical protein